MLETLAGLLAAGLAWLAFALLALAQERHWDSVARVPGPGPVRRRWHRCTAASCMAAALLLCTVTAGGGLGVLLWAFLCFAAAFSVSLTLTWWPWQLAPLTCRGDVFRSAAVAPPAPGDPPRR